MTSGPTPAVVGLNTPDAETPCPDHVPPAGVAFNCTGASDTHKGF